MSDAAIPLSVRPMQVDSPLDSVGRAVGLKAAAQGIQLNQARLDEERLKVQQAQEDARDQQTIQQGYAQYPGDFKKVRETIAPKVNTRSLANFDRAVEAHAAGMAKMSQDEIALRKERYSLLANHLGAVMQVKPGDKSPQGVAARAAEWAKQVTLAKANNQDPDNQIPLEFPGDEALPVLDVQLRGDVAHMKSEEDRRKAAEEAEKAKRDAAEETRKAAKAPVELEELQTKAALAARQSAASILASAETQEEYAAHYANLKPDVAKNFPKPDAFDAKKTPGKIRQIGQTSEQQVVTSLTSEQRDAQRETNTERERHDRAMEMIDAARAARERGQTANSQAVDRRMWKRELDKIKQEEESTALQRSDLETALKEGKLYVDSKGVTRNMQDAAKSDDATVNALTQKMKNSYAVLTNRLKRITADKNDLGQELGMGITVPTDKIHSALDADLERVSKIGQVATPAAAAPKAAMPAPVAQPAAKPAAPPAAPRPAAVNKPAAAPKAFPRDRLAGFAKANNMSPQEAEKQLTEQGYSVR